MGRAGMHWVGLALAALMAGPAAAQAPLKIGVLSDMSGFVVDLSGPGSLTAARMAVEDYGGKVLGRPIEILQGDHQNKPDIGVTMARRWYDEGVKAIFDIGITTVALGVQNLAREKDGLVVFVSSSSSDLTNSRPARRTGSPGPTTTTRSRRASSGSC